jgi:hypothetical protein
MRRNRKEQSLMKMIYGVLFGAALGAVTLCAQPAATGNPVVSESKQAYNGIKTNLTGMAEKMPAGDYGFKASPDIRTFGELMAHIADSQLRMCSSVVGAPKTGTAASKKAKDDLVAALKASFDECDAAWASVTDTNFAEIPSGGRRSRLGSLIANTTHDNEEYGYGAIYLRLKGIVPPSSDRSMAPGR